MPNHTTNHLRVTGPDASIAKMQEFANGKDSVLDCNAIIPMPESLRDTIKGSGMANDETLEETHAREQNEAKLVEEHGHDNWYDWCNANWGTKWGTYSIGDEPLAWEEEIDGVYIAFYTAWSPPMAVIAELARRFPDLRFALDYSDEYGGYAGDAVFQGEECEDDCHEDREGVEAKNREMGLARDDNDEE